MIQGYNNNIQVLPTNTSDIKFDVVDIRTRSANCNFPGWLQYTTGTSEFTILDGGLYDIYFKTNVTSATAGAVALAIKSNGSELPGTEVDATVATADDYHNVGLTKAVRTCLRTNTVISVGSIASNGVVDTQAPTIKNSSIIIERVA